MVTGWQGSLMGLLVTRDATEQCFDEHVSAIVMP